MKEDPIAELLGQYFRAVYTAAGLPWQTSDDAQMKTLSDEIRRVANHEAQTVIQGVVNPSALI